MGKAPTKKATGGPFNPLHTSMYGLKVMERCPDTQRVISVRCQFCIKSGVEVDPTKPRQRAPIKGNMAWTGSFRTDKYTDHHERQHPIEWARYKACSFDEKAKFFADITPHTNTMLPHINVGLAAAPLELRVLKPIVDVIISDMFFHPDKQGGTTQTTALKSFKRVDGVDDYYEVHIQNPMQFRLVVSWVSGGASFRQCVRFVADTRRILGLPRIGTLNEAQTSNYARIILARSLHLIATVLDPLKNRSMWAFSLASDASTHHGRSYLANRISIHADGRLYNLHLVAVPMYEHHTGENMFILIRRILDVVSPRWRMQMIGVGSDGANSMMGQFQGIVTRLANESANKKFYRVWCGLHQLDLVLKHAYMDLWENEVVELMKKFIAYLRMQQSLINEMQSTCPQLTTRWLMMGVVCKWLLTHRIALFNHIATSEKIVSAAPPDWWWIIIAAIDALTDLINPVFRKLQAPSLLISTQTTLIESLAVDIATMIGIRLRDVEDVEVSEGFIVGHDRWWVDYVDILKFLESLGMHTRHTLDGLDHDTHRKVLQSVGELGARIVDGLTNIQTERVEENHAGSDLPHVLPHELVKMPTGEFGKTIVDVHLQQLQHSWDEECIAGIEREHRELITAYRNEPALKSAIEAYTRVEIKSFETAWEVVNGRFEILRDFCGGIATMFANTASAESDFSILGWEMDDHRLSMTDLSLEGILHCKQFDIIEKLAS